jgi:predicted ATP-grasp superfamily ATP-dependent carboligase
MRALVIDGGHAPSALAAVRELGAAGWQVGVGTAHGNSFAAASRWCGRRFEVASPVDSLDQFIAGVNQAVAAGGYEVVFVSGDAEAMAVSFARDEIVTRVPYADHATMQRSVDKLGLSEAAEKAGVPTPRTWAGCEGVEEGFEGPIIVKCRFHWEPGRSGGTGRLEARIVPDPAAARVQAERVRLGGGEPVYQEVVDGKLMGFTVLTDRDGETVAELQQMAPLTWRPRVGMPARAYTVPVEPSLARAIRRMLKELGWFGLVQLQFIVDRAGRPHLIDFNGRAYASEGLAFRAGINFHDVWGRIATGRDWVRPGPARIGRRYQWTEGDLRRSLVDRTQSRPLGVAGCLRYGVGAEHPIWKLSDPGPFLRYPADLLRRFRKPRTAGRPIWEPAPR